MVAEFTMSPEDWGLVTAKTAENRRAEKILSIKESIMEKFQGCRTTVFAKKQNPGYGT